MSLQDIPDGSNYPSHGLDAGGIPTDAVPRSRNQDIEQMQMEDLGQQVRKHPRRNCFLSYTAGVATFLAIITYLSGLIASEDRGWRLTFFASVPSQVAFLYLTFSLTLYSLFTTWLLVIGTGLVIDLYHRSGIEMVKRPLWHIGCCLFILYIIVSTVKPPPEQLPQFIPGIVDIGLGISIGIQELPPDTRRRAVKQVTDLLGNIFGCICPNNRHSTAR
ncbi:hypothetical protein BKA65DRAFT_496371 [Rhexocercosporidium sp. MPI-PUGE-AT-0058]|nr:hypothetical protein BKA65DRAFT_496371 [Rhexocercosporidium sp. MPI-PUGE-AT-0058]